MTSCCSTRGIRYAKNWRVNNLPGNKNNDSANQNISPELGIQPLFQSSKSSWCIQVFIWIGQEANEVERKESLITCREYLRTHPGARDPDTPIVLTKQGFEPPTFTGWFTAWDAAKWSVSISMFNRKNARKCTKKGVFLNRGGRTMRSWRRSWGAEPLLSMFYLYVYEASNVSENINWQLTSPWPHSSRNVGKVRRCISFSSPKSWSTKRLVNCPTVLTPPKKRLLSLLYS